jgi:DNA repair photolyase
MPLDVIRDFDPWNDPLCTCPAKYGFNPYTGCAHRCVYCYITSYIPRAFECRPKPDLIQRVKRDLRKIDRRRFVSMSNSSDPYPPLEKRFELTRECLELFQREKIRVQIVTKSDLVLRDLDLLKEMECVVSFTITTLKPEIKRKLEPRAPPSKQRLKAMGELAEEGIPVTLRLDPVFPGLNEDEAGEIVKEAVRAGALHVTSSTFKPRPDSWRRFAGTFPEIAERLRELYFERGMKHHNCWYLPRGERERLMRLVQESCTALGVGFAACREGLQLNAPSCDGSYLLGQKFPNSHLGALRVG